MSDKHEARRLTAALRPLCDAAGLDLEDLAVAPAGRRSVLRIVVDRDGGVDLDAVAEISREISTALDSDGLMGDVPYVLEVSSPGVDRPLTAPAHWRRAVGRLVAVDLRAGGSVAGRLTGGDESGADLLDESGGTTRRVEYAEVARARVQVEFSRVGSGDADPANIEELDGEEVR
ncbi:MAG TPA: ribosome maturation factor RimP [Sporichthyaceae bacterium]|jgi:ribosome maturation factor RimP|nr:ribosome maturation factor RimP [Sporichthyaceae bacterium]